MVPDPHRGGGAAAVTALGMVGIGEDAHRLFADGLAFLAHGNQAAVGAAHAAGHGVAGPALSFELFELCFGRKQCRSKARGRRGGSTGFQKRSARHTHAGLRPFVSLGHVFLS